MPKFVLVTSIGTGDSQGAPPPQVFVADAPESDLERAMREAAGKKTTEPRAHGR